MIYIVPCPFARSITQLYTHYINYITQYHVGWHNILSIWTIQYLYTVYGII